jgi:hypothetical protein
MELIKTGIKDFKIVKTKILNDNEGFKRSL